MQFACHLAPGTVIAVCKHRARGNVQRTGTELAMCKHRASTGAAHPRGAGERADVYHPTQGGAVSRGFALPRKGQ